MEWRHVGNFCPSSGQYFCFLDEKNNMCIANNIHIWEGVKGCHAMDHITKESKKFFWFYEIDFHPDHLKMNKICKVCGEEMNISCHAGYKQTLVAYHSPKGHDHDDNCKTKIYQCKNGHKLNLSILNKCPSCDWQGIVSCFCCLKVDEWPKESNERL